MTSVLLWSLRGLWVILPAALGPALAGALEARSAPVGLVLETFLWIGWGIGLVAVAVPRVLSLTVVRTLATLAAGTALWATLAEGIDAADVPGATVAAAILVVALTPHIGEAFVDGSSYGPERRFPLRPPAALLFGPVPLAAAAVGAGAVAGPLLLAAHRWALGAALTAIGLPVAFGAARALHGLSRRWLVLVPGGIVVHDPLALGDPVLLPKGSLVSVSAAEADTGATDLTQRASGLAVEIRIADPGEFVLLRPGSRDGQIVTTSAVLVTPSRPAAFVAAVNDRY